MLQTLIIPVLLNENSIVDGISYFGVTLPKITIEPSPKYPYYLMYQNPICFVRLLYLCVKSFNICFKLIDFPDSAKETIRFTDIRIESARDTKRE